MIVASCQSGLIGAAVVFVLVGAFGFGPLIGFALADRRRRR